MNADQLIRWTRRQLIEHEGRDSADNEWWDGYIAALQDVLAAADKDTDHDR